MKQIADRLEAHQASMYRICLRVLRHPQDAEDACQEALIQAARHADSVREDFGAWARRVALTTALDVRRRRERRRAHEAKARPPEPASPEPLEVEHALSALDEPSRRAVAAHYLDGRPLRELAREAGVSEVAIWKRLSKAKGKLRIFLTAALPAALIGAALLLVLLRHPAVDPSSPATPQEEAWPWELPPRAWPEPVRKTWTALQKRVTLDMQDVPLPDMMEMVSMTIGQPIVSAPEAVAPDEIVSIKLSDIAADGALRLMLQPRGKGYRIRDDGTIVVDRIEGILASPDGNRSRDLEAAQRLEEAAREIRNWPSRPLAFAESTLEKRIREPRGEFALKDYLARLGEAGGANVRLDGSVPDPVVEGVRVTGRGEELPLGKHLRLLPPSVNLVPVPALDGTLVLMRPDDAAERRASDEWRAQKRVESALDGPFDGAGVATVPQLVRRLEKFLGAPVLAAKAAWESALEVPPAAGQTPAQVLEALRARGFRWAVKDATLYIVK